MAVQSETQQTLHERLGDLLYSQGTISEEDLDAALTYKRQHGVKLGQALLDLRMISQADLGHALRKQGRIFCINLNNRLVDRNVASKLGEDRSRRFQAIAVNRIAEVVTVAMEDPADVYTVDQIAICLKSTVLAVRAEPALIALAIDHVFRRRGFSGLDLEDIASRVMFDGNDIDFESVQLETDESDPNVGNQKPVIQLMQGIVEEAYEAGASDIHMESHEDRFTIRYRVDGTLFERLSLPRAWAKPCVARLKVASHMDIAQRRMPQDGRTELNIGERRVDLRVATTPTLHGESAVVRILDGGQNIYDLASLGLDEAQKERLEHIVSGKDGIVLATGPTGSGKTTTLYALLQRLHTSDVKIITLEDPVENQLDGITQINTHPKAGLTFATGLRSILRQDPDVILVGEIRDPETAQIAVQAALTGHIVLSTLHTVGTAETVTRLVDLGLEPFLLADTLRGVIAQRLVRKLCDRCKRTYVPSDDVLRRLSIDAKEADDNAFFEPVGCDECHGSGFKGRVAIYEIVRVTRDICGLISSGAETKTLRQAFLEMEFSSLREEGLRKVYDGVTTLQEVFGVTPQG